MNVNPIDGATTDRAARTGVAVITSLHAITSATDEHERTLFEDALKDTLRDIPEDDVYAIITFLGLTARASMVELANVYNMDADEYVRLFGEFPDLTALR